MAAVLASLAGRPAAEVVDAVLSEVLAFSAGPPGDDVAALVLQAT